MSSPDGDAVDQGPGSSTTRGGHPRPSARATAYALRRTLETSMAAIAGSLVGRLDVKRADALIAAWSRDVVRAAEVDLTVEGLGQVPRDRACVYMSNHQSHFDVPLLYSVFPSTLRMVAKKELFAVPVFGRALSATGFVCVDRSGDRDQARAAMRQAREAIERGISIWIAPEGTRSLDGRLGPFKKGGFLLAREAGADLVPIAIDGTRTVLPKGGRLLRTGAHVRLVFGPPLAVAGKDTATLMDEVRAFLAAHVARRAAPGL